MTWSWAKPPEACVSSTSDSVITQFTTQTNKSSHTASSFPFFLFCSFDMILFDLFSPSGLSHMTLLSHCLKAALRCPTVYIDLSEATLTTFDNAFPLQRLSDIGFCSLCFQLLSITKEYTAALPPPQLQTQRGKRRHLQQLLLVVSLTLLSLVLLIKEKVVSVSSLQQCWVIAWTHSNLHAKPTQGQRRPLQQAQSEKPLLNRCWR